MEKKLLDVPFLVKLCTFDDAGTDACELLEESGLELLESSGFELLDESLPEDGVVESENPEPIATMESL